MDFDEIEDLVAWNLSFNITVYDTLEMLGRLDLLDILN